MNTLKEAIEEKRHLEALVLNFFQDLRQAAKQETKEGEEAEYWSNRYMEHFGITKHRVGSIGEFDTEIKHEEDIYDLK